MTKYKLIKPLTLDTNNIQMFMYDSKRYRYLGDSDKYLTRICIKDYLTRMQTQLKEKYGITLDDTTKNIELTPELNIIFKTIRDADERLQPNELCLIINNIGKQEYWSVEKGMHVYYAVMHYGIRIRFADATEKLNFLNEYFMIDTIV